MSFNGITSIFDESKLFDSLISFVDEFALALFNTIPSSKVLVEMINNADYLVILGSSLLVNTVGRLIDAFIRKNGYIKSTDMPVISKEELDKDHYGLQKGKESVIMFIL